MDAWLDWQACDDLRFVRGELIETGFDRGLVVVAGRQVAKQGEMAGLGLGEGGVELRQRLVGERRAEELQTLARARLDDAPEASAGPLSSLSG